MDRIRRRSLFSKNPLRGGFILKTGRFGLIELLQKWIEIGVNHAALGIQFGKRPIGETLDELAKEVLPYFKIEKTMLEVLVSNYL